MLRIGPPPPPNVSPTGPPPGPSGPGAGGPPPELLAAIKAMQAQGMGASQEDPSDDDTADPSTTPPTKNPKFDAEKVSPDVARYLDPDAKCGSCAFFGDDGTSCNIVSGPIDPGGTCSLFTPLGKSKSKPDMKKESPDGIDGSNDGSLPPDSSGQ